MSKFVEFDKKLKSHIERGIRRFSDLSDLMQESALQINRLEPFRVTDRRLQAMKKKGEIHFDQKTGWMLGPKVLE